MFVGSRLLDLTNMPGKIHLVLMVFIKKDWGLPASDMLVCQSLRGYLKSPDFWSLPALFDDGMHNIGDVLQIQFLWDDVHQHFFTTILKGNMFVIFFQAPKQSKQIQEKKSPEPSWKLRNQGFWG